jgi:DNA-3-methyladenine glycosylase II
MKEIVSHLSKDTQLKELVDVLEFPLVQTHTDGNTYLSLLRAIISQQLSTKVAKTIYERFLVFFDNNPTPQQVIEASLEELRSVGLSKQKAGYIQNIALFSIEKGMGYERLSKMIDTEIINYLTEIKGVGKWTVEMLLMSNLGRLDVFPEDDLGIQQAMMALYKIDNSNKKTMKQEMTRIASAWQPYRSVACRYLWRWKDQ